jgi:anti-anti-sigma regulatory factor/HAMP domain-containing protein
MARLRTRFVISGLVITLLVIGAVGLFFAERRSYNQQVNSLREIQAAVVLARELSLYTQYNAHDTAAYTLGNPEHRQEFAAHAQAFSATLSRLQQLIDSGMLDDDEQEQTSAIGSLREQYDSAAEALFAAADANRASPSAEGQAGLEQAWQEQDRLGDAIDAASQELATRIGSDVANLQAALATDGHRALWALMSVGGLTASLMLLVQLLGARAIGRPMERLLTGVLRFTAGSYDTRVTSQSRDEVGDLARAFNTLAGTIQEQTARLRSQTEAAEAARRTAEAAQAEIAEQLATIEQQQLVIREMSVPVLPVGKAALVMPLVGALDSARLMLIQEQALRALQDVSARHLIVYITGVPVIDTEVAQGLIQVVQAARLLGTQAILVGIRPEVAQAIVGLGIDLRQVTTRSTLLGGIEYALGAAARA